MGNLYLTACGFSCVEPLESPYGLNRVDKRIIELANDNTSGASELVEKAVGCFVAFAENFEGEPNDFYQQLVSIGRKVIRAQPSMAPMFNCVNDLLCTLEGMARGIMTKLTMDWAKAYMGEVQKARRWVTESAKRLIRPGETIMTYSYSSAILDIIKGCKDKDLSVIVSEGRPVNEGLRMAELLGREDIDVLLLVDAALPSHIKRADRVLVGADAMTEQGVVNKVGTRGVAQAAKYDNVPFLVAAERNKFVMSGYFRPRFDEHTPLEITHRRTPNVTVRNIYFDSTPWDLVTGVITEDGLKGPDECMEYLKGRKICNDLLVEDLDITPAAEVEKV